MPKYRGGAPVVAANFAANHQSFVGMTLTEIATWYGVTNGTMRTALRQAEARLASAGLVVCVPMRSNGYVLVVTDDELTFLESVLTRVAPIRTEVGRWDGQHSTVAAESLFGDLAVLLDDVMGKISERLIEASAD